MAKIKMTINTICWQGGEITESLSHIVGENVKWYNHFGKRHVILSYKISIYIPHAFWEDTLQHIINNNIVN